jgi:regulator of sigma E protease
MNLIAVNWTQVGLMAGQLLLALSLLVVLHEFGHFITARWFKCRVEKFFLFFDPWFALVKKKVGDTVYGIGWLPLGGYVKISGMIDESMDKEAMKLPPKEWEFRAKPAWQRLIVMMGGIIMNVLVAFVIYAFILMTWGEKKIPTASMKYGIHVADSTIYKMGLRNGDKIISIDGAEVTDYEKLRRRLLLGSTVRVDRNGEQVDLALDVDLIGQLVENRSKDATGFVEVRRPAIAFYVPDTSNAYKAGLRKDDQLLGVDSTRVEFYDELQNELKKHKDQSVMLTVKRNGEEIRCSLRGRPSADG